MQNYSLLFPHCPSTCKTGGLNSSGDVRMGIITKAKKSCTAFEKPGPRRHMALSCIAMGLLQSLSIYSIGKISSDQIRYQRTPSQGRVSEARMMHNANNSWTTGRVRRTLGFSGFLVVQTFNCQVNMILTIFSTFHQNQTVTTTIRRMEQLFLNRGQPMTKQQNIRLNFIDIVRHQSYQA